MLQKKQVDEAIEIRRGYERNAFLTTKSEQKKQILDTLDYLYAETAQAMSNVKSHHDDFLNSLYEKGETAEDEATVQSFAELYDFRIDEILRLEERREGLALLMKKLEKLMEVK